jgi:hypothetical protein
LCFEPTQWALTNKEKIEDHQVAEGAWFYFQILYFPDSLNALTPGIVLIA